jgi:mevalonate kinase
MSPSKILLFGEYSILVGSDALAIPFSKFFGTLQFISSKQSKSIEVENSNRQLEQFCNYLGGYDDLGQSLDLSKFKSDIENGLYFHSNIPIRYGLGSSGAVTAEVFRNYSNINLSNTNEIQELLAKMESFFHGKSSGIDALVSFLNRPLFISKGCINQVKPKHHNISIFLVDTAKHAETKGVVNEFLRYYEQDTLFRKTIDNTYVPLVNKAIEYFINCENHQFIDILRQLSSFQLTNFKHLIPEQFQNAAIEGLSKQQFYLKICGSGGGGFLLGFTLIPEETKAFFIKRKIDIMFIKF